MTQEQLKKAVKDGVISSEQEAKLKSYIDEDNQTSEHEPLKFIRSFGDVFIAVSIAVVTFILSMLTSGNHLFGVGSIALLVVMSEWLVGQKKLLFPGIVLLLGILYLVEDRVVMLGIEQFSAVIATGISLLYFLRYRLSFAAFVSALSLIYVTYTMISGLEFVQTNILVVLFIYGVLVFTTALYFDARDTMRESYLSDVGFWLHLVAAPMMIHSTMFTLFGLEDGAVYMSIFCLILVFLALLIDRRAMLISAVLYGLLLTFRFVYADIVPNMVNSMMSASPESININPYMPLYIILAFSLIVIVTGVYWYELRKTLYGGWMPKLVLSKYLPKFTKHPYSK